MQHCFAAAHQLRHTEAPVAKKVVWLVRAQLMHGVRPLLAKPEEGAQN